MHGPEHSSTGYRSGSTTIDPQKLCEETYGKGYVGTYPNCTYNPNISKGPDTPAEEGPFTGTVESLGYGDILKGSTWEEGWEKFFDPYDTGEEEMLTKAWDIKGKQLGQGWALKGGELAATARTGYGQVGRAGETAYKGSDLAFSGTISDIERQKRGEVTESYKRSFGLGQTAYEQAMETGGLQLEADIFGLQKDWRQEQRSTLNMLLGQGIWPEDDVSDPTYWDERGESEGTTAGESMTNEAKKTSCEARGGNWNGYSCDV